MSSPSLEAFLARLYSDRAVLAAFLEMPADQARKAGLSTSEIAALLEIDREGLVMAARSYRAKREGRAGRACPIGKFGAGLSDRLRRWSRR